MLHKLLAPAAALTITLSASGGGECGALTLRGDADVDLTTGATTQRRAPDLVYNPIDREYMVVWFDTRNPGNNDIFGQRVDLDGAPIGGNVAIMEFASAQIDPAITHDSTFNGYLAAWRTQQSGFFNKTRGRLLNPDGTPNGGDFFIGEGFETQLAYNPKSPEYWQTGRGAGIRGQRVSISGDLEGGSIAIATSGAPAPNGGIAYNDNADRFFVTWRDQTDRNLKGRRYESNGVPFGLAFVISDEFPGTGRSAAVAFDRFADRYLVVFAVFQENRILGQFMTPNGTRDGAAFTIADNLASTPVPDVAFTFDDYVVAWTDGGSVKAKHVLGDGTVCDQTLAIAAGTAAGGVAIARGASADEVLFTWVDNRNLGAGQQDIYARVVEIGPACPADLDGSGDVGFPDLVMVLAAWGESGGPEDIDGSGTVGFGDVVALLAAWGPCV